MALAKVPIMLRVPKTLHKKLVSRARANGRSLNSEICLNLSAREDRTSISLIVERAVLSAIAKLVDPPPRPPPPPTRTIREEIWL